MNIEIIQEFLKNNGYVWNRNKKFEPNSKFEKVLSANSFNNRENMLVLKSCIWNNDFDGDFEYGWYFLGEITIAKCFNMYIYEKIFNPENIVSEFKTMETDVLNLYNSEILNNPVFYPNTSDIKLMFETATNLVNRARS